jgi:glycosyltransferase involved in cell wall biosynthesis
MKIFMACNSLLPSYGGPAYSVSRLTRALSAAGLDVGLWSPDQSAPTTPLVSDDDGIRRLSGAEDEALDDFGRPDIVHDNGIWMPHHHRGAVLAAQRAIPRVVSTRGMLSAWALRHKRWKKGAAWWLYQRRDLRQARRHHVTAEAEAASVERLGFGVPVCLIPNGVDVPDLPERVGAMSPRAGPKTALFLGRIYPVKGLPMLVQAWARARCEGWVLHIAGPDEAGHRREVERAVADAGLGGVVSFLGELDPEGKRNALLNADVFVLPTYSENFGMAIGEALAHGLPVVTTTGAPWPALETHRCGWWVKPTVEGIAEGLRAATATPAEELAAMGARGRDFVMATFGWDQIARRFVAMYESVLSEP